MSKRKVMIIPIFCGSDTLVSAAVVDSLSKIPNSIILCESYLLEKELDKIPIGATLIVPPEIIDKKNTNRKSSVVLAYLMMQLRTHGWFMYLVGTTAERLNWRIKYHLNVKA